MLAKVMENPTKTHRRGRCGTTNEQKCWNFLENASCGHGLQKCVLPATLRKFYKKKRLPTLGQKRTCFGTFARDVLSFGTFCDTSRLKTRIPPICDTSRAKTPKIGWQPPKVTKDVRILEKTANSPPKQNSRSPSSGFSIFQKFDSPAGREREGKRFPRSSSLGFATFATPLS